MNATTTSFDELAGLHRRAIHVHCYRMVGSFAEADDLVQETLLRAWNARDTFDPNGGEADMRLWWHERTDADPAMIAFRDLIRRASARGGAGATRPPP